jgi:hypothetical protein
MTDRELNIEPFLQFSEETQTYRDLADAVRAAESTGQVTWITDDKGIRIAKIGPPAEATIDPTLHVSTTDTGTLGNCPAGQKVTSVSWTRAGGEVHWHGTAACRH